MSAKQRVDLHGAPQTMLATLYAKALDAEAAQPLLDDTWARDIVDRFPAGELHFDAFNRLGIKAQWMNGVVRRSGATLHWGIDGADDILASVPGTELLQWVPVFESDSFARVGGAYRAMAAVMNQIPGLRSMAQFHRYSY